MFFELGAAAPHSKRTRILSGPTGWSMNFLTLLLPIMRRIVSLVVKSALDPT
jgi:hypothetical protein